MTPDFSPSMLQFFLTARAILRAADDGLTRAQRIDRLDIYLAEIARDIGARAGVSRRAAFMAAHGRLRNPRMRARLWGALGIVPADHGITLTLKGQKNG